ncbi:MAG TPA: glycosyltransferase family 39 protein [Geobacterales bacterium]|nr:glycosyltransferase family 39 protein [Geobacterales bacterium]
MSSSRQWLRVRLTSSLNPERLMLLLVIILAIAWVFPGLLGHDPWKADEPYSFGLVANILATGDLVVPTLAGEPFVEKPPLFYITAAGFALLFSSLLPLHDAARLASGFFDLITILFVALLGREILGRGKGEIAVLVLLGCIGFQDQAHKLITDTALVAGFAIALYGLALARRRSLLGGFWLGTGIGIGFMAKGLLAPGILGIIVGILPLIAREWRNSSYLHAIAMALLSAAPWLLIWPIALYARSPELFTEWLWVQNFGRFFNENNLGPPNKPGLYLQLLPWFAWPAFPLAAWGLWQLRGLWRNTGLLWLPLAAFIIMVAVLSLASDGRSLYALPLLVPLAVLGAAAVALLPNASIPSLNYSASGITASVILLLWVGWLAMQSGFPVSLADKLLQQSPSYLPTIEPLALGIALAYTAGWLCIVIVAGKGSLSPLIRWSSGIVTAWGLLMTLWLPWFNAGSSYQSVFLSCAEAMSEHSGPVASRGLGESERAMLDYYAGIVTERVETQSETGCDLMLVQGGPGSDLSPGPTWTKLWEGGRAGVTKERFVLWERQPSEIRLGAKRKPRGPVASGEERILGEEVSYAQGD